MAVTSLPCCSIVNVRSFNTSSASASLLGADLLLRHDLDRVAGTRLHADVAAGGFDLERAARLDGESLFDRAFDGGVKEHGGGKEPPETNDQREVDFHDKKAAVVLRS